MYILKILFKNAFRHKLRTGLTILSITIAILAFGLLRTVISAWYSGAQASSAYRLVTRNAISIIFPLPLSYKEKIEQIEGVTTVSYGNWFGGVYIDEKNFFASFAVEPETYLELYPEFVLSSSEKTAFLKDRKGCAVGRKLAERFGWKVGDNIVLKGNVYPGDWEFQLRAIYWGRDKNADESQFMLHYAYINETMKKTAPGRADQVGIYFVGIKDPDEAAAIAAEIDKTFKNSLAETMTETEKAFVLGFIAMSDAIITAIKLVSFVVIVIILAVVANTMTMSVRERTGEHAVLKTFGFGGWYIAGLIFGESIIITMMGCTLGIAATFPAKAVFAKAVGSVFPVFNIEPITFVLDVILSFAVGVLAGIVPTWRTMKMRIADGLRQIE